MPTSTSSATGTASGREPAAPARRDHDQAGDRQQEECEPADALERVAAGEAAEARARARRAPRGGRSGRRAACPRITRRVAPKPAASAFGAVVKRLTRCTSTRVPGTPSIRPSVRASASAAGWRSVCPSGTARRRPSAARARRRTAPPPATTSRAAGARGTSSRAARTRSRGTSRPAGQALHHGRHVALVRDAVAPLPPHGRDAERDFGDTRCRGPASRASSPCRSARRPTRASAARRGGR